jgi:hypothetical protein
LFDFASGEDELSGTPQAREAPRLRTQRRVVSARVASALLFFAEALFMRPRHMGRPRLAEHTEVCFFRLSKSEADRARSLAAKRYVAMSTFLRHVYRIGLAASDVEL